METGATPVLRTLAAHPEGRRRLDLTRVAGVTILRSQSGQIAGSSARESRRRRSFRLFCSPDATAMVPFLQRMNPDFIAGLEFWEREKGVSREVLMAAVEEALLQAAKKAVGPARELRVVMDSKSGDIKAFAKLIVADRVVSQHDQISVFDARRLKADAKVGDELEKEVTPQGFGRIAAQYAKQALMMKVRQAEKAMLLVEFKDRVGDIDRKG